MLPVAPSSSRDSTDRMKFWSFKKGSAAKTPNQYTRDAKMLAFTQTHRRHKHTPTRTHTLFCSSMLHLLKHDANLTKRHGGHGV